jgi:hypothetical protein
VAIKQYKSTNESLEEEYSIEKVNDSPNKSNLQKNCQMYYKIAARILFQITI